MNYNLMNFFYVVLFGFSASFLYVHVCPLGQLFIYNNCYIFGFNLYDGLAVILLYINIIYHRLDFVNHFLSYS